MSGTFLGFDFGTKSIGVAVGQRITATARPLPALKAQDGKPDWNVIEKLLKEWQPEAVIVGLPLNMDGTDSPRTQSTRAFARNLLPLALPVLLWDERWSTAAVERAMIAADVSRAKRAERIDSAAAAFILQGAIDALTRG